MLLAVFDSILIYARYVYYQGQATDIQIQAEEIIKLKRQINTIYVKHSKQPLSVIGKWKIRCTYITLCFLMFTDSFFWAVNIQAVGKVYYLLIRVAIS
jgi:Clp protease